MVHDKVGRSRSWVKVIPRNKVDCDKFIFVFQLQIGGKNQQGYTVKPIPLNQCVSLVKDVFTSAAERDIYTGDGVVIQIITKNGIQSEKFALRKD